MKINEYKVLYEAIDTGITLGLGSAFNHTDTPSRNLLRSSLEREIMNAICEWFEFDEPADN